MKNELWKPRENVIGSECEAFKNLLGEMEVESQANENWMQDMGVTLEDMYSFFHAARSPSGFDESRLTEYMEIKLINDLDESQRITTNIIEAAIDDK